MVSILAFNVSIALVRLSISSLQGILITRGTAFRLLLTRFSIVSTIGTLYRYLRLLSTNSSNRFTASFSNSRPLASASSTDLEIFLYGRSIAERPFSITGETYFSLYCLTVPRPFSMVFARYLSLYVLSLSETLSLAFFTVRMMKKQDSSFFWVLLVVVFSAAMGLFLLFLGFLSLN